MGKGELFACNAHSIPGDDVNHDDADQNAGSAGLRGLLVRDPYASQLLGGEKNLGDSRTLNPYPRANPDCQNGPSMSTMCSRQDLVMMATRFHSGGPTKLLRARPGEFGQRWRAEREPESVGRIRCDTEGFGCRYQDAVLCQLVCDVVAVRVVRQTQPAAVRHWIGMVFQPFQGVVSDVLSPPAFATLKRSADSRQSAGRERARRKPLRAAPAAHAGSTRGARWPDTPGSRGPDPRASAAPHRDVR